MGLLVLVDLVVLGNLSDLLVLCLLFLRQNLVGLGNLSVLVGLYHLQTLVVLGILLVL